MFKDKSLIISKTNMGFIYAIQNIITDTLYIGKTNQTINKRWKAHLSEMRRNVRQECRYLNRAIRKYGVNNFKVHEIDEIDEVSDEELNTFEEFYIEFFESFTPNGYNLTTGGEGCKPSEETRLKMSQWQKGKPKSQKHKESMSRYAKNRPQSHRDKIAEANRSRTKPVSAETRLKMSKAKRLLTDDDLIVIKELLKTKTHLEISKIYNVSEKHISRIKCGWNPKNQKSK